MAYIDEAGNVYTAPNSFLDIIIRMFSNSLGLLFVFIPLLILIGIYFIIKHYSKDKKILRAFAITALTVYVIYLFLVSQLFIAF